MRKEESSEFARLLTRRRIALLATIRNQRESGFESDGSLKRSQISAFSEELLLISDALNRLRRGIYGVCGVCGTEMRGDWLREHPYGKACACCQSDGQALASRADPGLRGHSSGAD